MCSLNRLRTKLKKGIFACALCTKENNKTNIFEQHYLFYASKNYILIVHIFFPWEHGRN